MTLAEFYDCEDDERDEVLQKGVLLMSRRDLRYLYELYQVDSIYVEVKRSLYYNMRKQLTAFNNTALLDPYIANMEIRI